MRLLALDPGIRTFGWVVLDNGKVIFQGGMHNYEGPDFDRVFVIAKMMRQIADNWKVSVFGSELFFGGVRNTQANYQRGALDQMLRYLLGHLPQCWLHPNHMKRFMTGHSHAKKSEVLAHIESHMDEAHSSALYEHIRRTRPTCHEHIVEAYALGVMTHWLWQGQYRHADESLISKGHRHVLTDVEEKKPWMKPRFSTPVPFPTTDLWLRNTPG